MPGTARAYLIEHFRCLRPILVASLMLSVLGAALEVWMIGFSGTLVDLLAASTPATLWAEHGGALVTAALLVGIVRPLLGFVNETVDDIALKPNAETLLRWRSHRHVLRQPVGWFRRELSGRVASWVLATGTSAVYAIVHTLVHVGVYILAGRIAESGTHAELIARDGIYALLWARQSGGFLGLA